MVVEDRVREVTVDWAEGMRFAARTASGAVTSLDGEGRLSPSPVETLLAALGGCMGIDVVEILRKGRAEPEALEVEVRGTRRGEDPRSFERLEVTVRIRGEVPRAKAERAVDLSLETYCSVYHSLDPAIELVSRVELVDEDPGGRGG